MVGTVGSAIAAAYGLRVALNISHKEREQNENIVQAAHQAAKIRADIAVSIVKPQVERGIAELQIITARTPSIEQNKRSPQDIKYLLVVAGHIQSLPLMPQDATLAALEPIDGKLASKIAMGFSIIEDIRMQARQVLNSAADEAQLSDVVSMTRCTLWGPNLCRAQGLLSAAQEKLDSINPADELPPPSAWPNIHTEIQKISM